MIRDRNDKNLTEEEEIKKKQKEYTKGLYKEELKDPDNQDGDNSLRAGNPRVKLRSQGDLLQTKPGEVMKFQLSYLKS